MAADRAWRLPGGELLIAVGRLGRPHGVKGEIKLTPFFGSGLMENLAGKQLYLETEGESPPTGAIIEQIRPAAKFLLASFAGVESPEQAADFANRLVFAPKSLAPKLPEGKFFYEEVVGLPVFDPQGAMLGKLTAFFESGAADVWVITNETGEEIMNPCLPETLIEVDIEKGRIVMRLMEME